MSSPSPAAPPAPWVVIGIDNGGTANNATVLTSAGDFLVDRLVEPADLEDEVRRFAQVLAARSALTQRATKEIVAALTEGSDAEALAAPRYRETISAGELPEGVAAFAERRPPRFGWTG